MEQPTRVDNIPTDTYASDTIQVP